MPEKDQNEDFGKKRVAHPSAATCVTRQVVVNHSKKSTNPQQKMYERWRLMRDAVAEKSALASSAVPKDVRRNHVEPIGTAHNSELKLNGNGNYAYGRLSRLFELIERRERGRMSGYFISSVFLFLG